MEYVVTSGVPPLLQAQINAALSDPISGELLQSVANGLPENIERIVILYSPNIPTWQSSVSANGQNVVVEVGNVLPESLNATAGSLLFHEVLHQTESVDAQTEIAFASYVLTNSSAFQNIVDTVGQANAERAVKYALEEPAIVELTNTLFRIPTGEPLRDIPSSEDAFNFYITEILNEVSPITPTGNLQPLPVAPLLPVLTALFANGANATGGDDNLVGTGGSDTIDGLAGDDEIFGGAGNDFLYGSSGNDSIFGGDNFDTIYGGEGNDLVEGGNGQDVVYLNQGNDTYNDNTQGGTLGQDTVFAGYGDDTINGGAGNDTFYGEWGNDLIYAGDGNDVVFGGDQFDTIYGGKGNDTVGGGNGRDVVFLNQGNDTYNDNAQGGYLGQDKVFAGYGDDTINGGAGNDTFYGEWGSDLIYAGAGDDVVFGGDQFDTIYGGSGADRLYGGSGDNHLYGGSGSDTFIFNLETGTNSIHDFDVSEDKIDLSLVSDEIQNLFQLQSYHMTEVGSDVIIDWAGSDKIVLENVSLSDLSYENYIFALDPFGIY